MSQKTANTVSPSKNGCSPEPANAKKCAPRWMRNVDIKKSGVKCAIKYAAMEFMPTTTSGNAHFL